MDVRLTAPLICLVILSACFLDMPGGAVVSGEKDPNLHPAVQAFFDSGDPFVQEVVLPNIEAHRKSNVVLTVVDAEGHPLAGAAVSATLKRHEFLFGHCDLATERNPEKRRLLSELFHFTCPGNITKWRAYAKEPGRRDFANVDAALEFCEKRGIDFEWHFLSGYHPDWLEDLPSVSEKARHQVENSKAVLRRYGDRVRFFQVINEDYRTHVDRAKVYVDQTAWFAELREEFPEVELGVCDCWSFNAERQLPGVEELEERYPGIDFVSMHAHNPRQLWASPEEMYATFDPYLGSGVMIHLTEFGIILGEITGGYRTGDWDEDKLAEYFVQAMATAFSHRQVRAFNLWSNYDKFTGNPLFSADGRPNEKHKAIESLLQERLTTRVAGGTDEAGRFSFRGFHGSYELTVTPPSGAKASARAEIAGESTALRLLVDRRGGTLKILSPSGTP